MSILVFAAITIGLVALLYWLGKKDSYTADLVSLRREWQARGLPDPTVEDYAFNRNFRLTVVGRGKPKQSIAMLEQ